MRRGLDKGVWPDVYLQHDSQQGAARRKVIDSGKSPLPSRLQKGINSFQHFIDGLSTLCRQHRQSAGRFPSAPSDTPAIREIRHFAVPRPGYPTRRQSADPRPGYPARRPPAPHPTTDPGSSAPVQIHQKIQSYGNIHSNSRQQHPARRRRRLRLRVRHAADGRPPRHGGGERDAAGCPALRGSLRGGVRHRPHAAPGASLHAGDGQHGRSAGDGAAGHGARGAPGRRGGGGARHGPRPHLSPAAGPHRPGRRS